MYKNSKDKITKPLTKIIVKTNKIEIRRNKSHMNK